MTPVTAYTTSPTTGDPRTAAPEATMTPPVSESLNSTRSSDASTIAADATIPPPPPPRSDPARLSQQQSDLRRSRNPNPNGPQCLRNQPTNTSHPPTAILISGTSNMTFQALTTDTMPDLALIAGSRQTRAIPRQTQ